MPNKDVIKTIGVLPRLLYYGGWIILGVLVVVILYNIILNVIKR